MAYDYEKAKQLYQGMNKEQQQQFVNQNKNDANFQRFMGDYMNEINGKSTTTQQAAQNNANSNIGSGTNGQNSIQETANNINNEVNAGAEQIKKQQEVINKNQKLLEQEQNQYDPNETLQTDKFQQTDKGVVVKEGTAAQTGKPDYQLDSDARTQEITNNLNSYYQTNPEYFKDRNTFNSIFHYNERSDSQKALLDSYWGKTKLSQSTAQYGTPKAITEGLNNYDITEEQLNFLKDNSPEVYQQWQEAQQEKINLWISNDSRLDVADLTSQLTKIQEGLNLVSKSYNLIQTYEDKMQEYDVIGKMNDYNNYVNKIDGKVSEKEAIIRKYSNAGADTMGGAAANFARMQRALAPINSTLSDYYQVASMKQQGYQMAFAQAKQDVAVVQAQAQEDQRVFNNNLQALGFAMDVMDYRTPEQKMQMQLQQQYMSGQISLLQQSQMNDINRYNQYATAKMQSQLNYDLTDLSVSDPKQLKTNLNNVLSEYYNAYGDIIKRSQSETLNDVLKYAEENNVSVAEALRKNFIEKLQDKDEYKAKIAESYGTNKYQQQYSYSIDENGNIKATVQGYGQLPQSLTRQQRTDIFKGINSDVGGNPSRTAVALSGLADGSYTGQCGEFVNDYLVSIGVGKVFGNSLSDKMKYATQKEPIVGSVVVMDTGATYVDSNGKTVPAGHVGIITGVNQANGTIEITDSNWKADKTKLTHTTSINNPQIKGYYYPSGVGANSGIEGGYYDPTLEDFYNTSSAKFTSTQWKSIEEAGYSVQDYNQMKQNYQAEVNTKINDNELQLLRDLNELKTIGTVDYHQMTSGRYVSGWDKAGDYKTTYDRLIASSALKNLINLKGQGATFGALSDNELNFITNSSTLLSKEQTYSAFIKSIDQITSDLTDGIKRRGGVIPDELLGTDKQIESLYAGMKQGNYTQVGAGSGVNNEYLYVLGQ